MGINNDYEDIPGTYVFNGRRCREGYYLNKFCKSLDIETNRADFRANPDKYLDKFPMTQEQRDMIDKRDWLGMLQVGGNIYYTFKLSIFDGLSMQHTGAEMSHVTVEEFRQMMMNGGRSIVGNRSKSEKT